MGSRSKSTLSNTTHQKMSSKYLIDHAKEFLETTLGPEKFSNLERIKFDMVQFVNPSRQTELKNELMVTYATQKHREIIELFPRQEFLLDNKQNLWPPIGNHMYGKHFDPFGRKAMSVHTIKERNDAICKIFTIATNGEKKDIHIDNCAWLETHFDAVVNACMQGDSDKEPCGLEIHIGCTCRNFPKRASAIKKLCIAISRHDLHERYNKALKIHSTDITVVSKPKQFQAKPRTKKEDRVIPATMQEAVLDLADDQEKRAYDIIKFMNLVSEIFESGDGNFTKDQMVDLNCCKEDLTDENYESTKSYLEERFSVPIVDLFFTMRSIEERLNASVKRYKQFDLSLLPSFENHKPVTMETWLNKLKQESTNFIKMVVREFCESTRNYIIMADLGLTREVDFENKKRPVRNDLFKFRFYSEHLPNESSYIKVTENVCESFIASTNKMERQNKQTLTGSNYHKCLLKCQPMLKDLQKSYLTQHGDKITESPFLLYNFDPTKTFFRDDDKKGSKKPFGSPATYDSYVSARRTFFKNELGKRGFDVKDAPTIGCNQARKLSATRDEAAIKHFSPRTANKKRKECCAARDHSVAIMKDIYEDTSPNVEESSDAEIVNPKKKSRWGPTKLDIAQAAVIEEHPVERPCVKKNRLHRSPRFDRPQPGAKKHTWSDDEDA
jgi:hypothetical protein